MKHTFKPAMFRSNQPPQSSQNLGRTVETVKSNPIPTKSEQINGVSSTSDLARATVSGPVTQIPE